MKWRIEDFILNHTYVHMQVCMYPQVCTYIKISLVKGWGVARGGGGANVVMPPFLEFHNFKIYFDPFNKGM